MDTKTYRTVSTAFGEITYELERKKVKRMNLHVKRDQTVYLSIPFHTAYIYADKFVADNAAFIFESIAMLAEKAVLNTEYTRFLGKRLEIETKPSQKLGGELSASKENTLVLFLPPDTGNGSEYADFFEKALEIWQKEQAKELLPKALLAAHKRFDDAGIKVPYPTLTIRTMTTRWGSCSAYKNKVTLNVKLIEKPFACIEQVACHELAHFVVQNHSADFYKVMDIVMPEHREVNRILKQN